MIFSQVFPDAVKDDDGIVQRISDNRQQRSDDRQRKFFVKQGKNADGDNDIVYQRNDSAHGIF